MRNKTLIIVVTAIVAALCAFYLSFTYAAHRVEDRAAAYAMGADGKVNMPKRQAYLDSVWKTPVWLGYTYQELKQGELGLGLDLKGGMHVTMEVSPVEILRSMAGHSKDPNFNKAIEMAQQRQSTSQEPFTQSFLEAYREVAPNGKLGPLFANSANKGRISFNSTNEQVMAVVNGEVESAIDRSFNILRTRVDKFGVNQPNIQRLKGTGRIQIELPGVDNPGRVRKLLQGQAKLDFWEVYKAQEINPYLVQLNDYLVKKEAANKLNAASNKTTTDALANAGQETATLDLNTEDGKVSDTASASLADQLTKNTADSATAKADSLNSQQSSELARLFVPLPNGIGSNVRDTARVNQLMSSPDVRAIFPPNMTFLWGVKPIQGQDRQEFLELYAVKKTRSAEAQAPVTGEYVSDARQDFDQNGRPEVNMQMNPTGARKWQRMTSANIGRQVAIVLDDYVYSAPVVQSEIGGGNSSISGSFSIEEAQDLANVLKAGKLPAPTRIVEEAVVGPSLGREAIQQGLLSTIAGVVIIMLFMIGYYNKGGFVADIALAINIFFILGILAQFNTALTLPGIAGLVLTLAMAVDANVLIFERIREEISLGATVKEAINKGYSKAFSAIFDSNVTTLLTSAILYYFGSGPVKGFATTLGIGVLTSFLTAVYLSRVIIEAMTANKENAKISFQTSLSSNLFKNTNFDIIGKRKYAYMFSTGILVLGFIVMAIQGGPLLGVDFKGGRSYVVDFSQPVAADQARSALASSFGSAGTEVKTFGSDSRLKITTTYMVDDESTAADAKVEQALLTGLKSQFAAANPEIKSTSKVGATMADDIKQSSVLALLVSLIGIFLYVMVRFGGRWQFSLGAVIALFHDALFLLAGFALARLVGLSYEMDQVFIAAVLTVIGFSMNDTVIIYDRIREEMQDNPNLTFAEVVNPALNRTFSRTMITSTTVFLVVLVLYIFGGETLRSFSFAMLIGVLFGTYSSLFVAAAIVYDTTKKGKSNAELMHLDEDHEAERALGGASVTTLPQ